MENRLRALSSTSDWRLRKSFLRGTIGFDPSQKEIILNDALSNQTKLWMALKLCGGAGYENRNAQQQAA